MAATPFLSSELKNNKKSTYVCIIMWNFTQSILKVEQGHPNCLLSQIAWSVTEPSVVVPTLPFIWAGRLEPAESTDIESHIRTFLYISHVWWDFTGMKWLPHNSLFLSWRDIPCVRVWLLQGLYATPPSTASKPSKTRLKCIWVGSIALLRDKQLFRFKRNSLSLTTQFTDFIFCDVISSRVLSGTSWIIHFCLFS